MNDYSFSDYKIFDDAIATGNSFLSEVKTTSTSLESCSSKLNDESIFMGPICDSCVKGFSSVNTKITELNTKIADIQKYLGTASSEYKTGDTNSSNKISSTSIDTSKTTTADDATTGSLSTKDRENIVKFAESQLGVSYNYGDGPGGTGGAWENDIAGQQVSCNGLTKVCYEAAGLTIPAGSADQMSSMKVVSTGSLDTVQPGDIICFDTGSNRSDIDYNAWSYNHVAVYAGNGEIIESLPNGGVQRSPIEDGGFSYAVTYDG